jgi:hypothetical protein
MANAAAYASLPFTNNVKQQNHNRTAQTKDTPAKTSAAYTPTPKTLSTTVFTFLHTSRCATVNPITEKTTAAPALIIARTVKRNSASLMNRI